MAVIRDMMPAFELFQPATIDEAVKLLDRHGSSAWVMAGGLDTFDEPHRPAATRRIVLRGFSGEPERNHARR